VLENGKVFWNAEKENRMDYQILKYEQPDDAQL